MNALTGLSATPTTQDQISGLRTIASSTLRQSVVLFEA